jgi:hypothetical protein
LYAKPTTNYISGAFTANVVVREGSAVGSGAIISWQLVTLLDPADTGTPSATTNTNLGSSTIEDTTPLSVEILNDKNNTFTGDGITARIKGATGSVVNISAGFGEGSNPITTITLSSPSQDVLISSYISSFGIYSVVAESKGKVARDSINIQLSAG